MNIKTLYNIGDKVVLNDKTFPEDSDYAGRLGDDDKKDWDGAHGVIVGIKTIYEESVAEIVYKVGFTKPEWKTLTLYEDCLNNPE